MRTLYDILRSCFFTIAACVYRAIHQNIPDPTMTMWGRLWVRIKITIYALIAPEAMIWWAMRQRYGAIEVVKGVNRLDLGLNWTQTHGQFAQMGGFARKDNRYVLYPPTLIKLLQQGRIDLEDLQLSKDDIDDKSKGDILSKALVAFQTTWFVFECLARLQQGLPLIELEVVTLAFAVLNTVTYSLWWYKPLNVLRPIYVRVLPKASTAGPLQTGASSDASTREPDHEAAPLISRGMGMSEDRAVDSEADVVIKSRENETPVGRVEKERATRKQVEPKQWWMKVWKICIERPFFAVVGPLVDLFEDETVHEDATHVSTSYGMDIPGDKVNLVARLSCVIGLIFGAIHFISWHSTFPAHMQLTLWRISSVILVAQPAFIMLADLFNQMYKHASDGSWRELITQMLRNICNAAFLIGTIAFILARFCLLILALLALDHLPPHALDNITWTSYIPHL
ncbi:hypothetical protein BDN72DRAFT_771268 [Pluteus cervinus]|uniref:Uncharacterized protein n=1 Tax=Pluteus cervinus TaxID=181527 RepID=A0ACD3ANH4_9AGAR|nr:hypothetical protein BDN72DRAFT_771268 [Pluteus cervinus]